ncbi:MAG: Unknown protein [uncultured Sulfurovum sp.]|uniref:Trypsin-co-occurring domain-containing protein n=1 Tax=uncultured Sulfurovum sp. TaxID=269237 RepID=A0A6S6SBJ9_9BACT|nr:MAG: Unknown protein [uncultured Sulfurovum sp.]
MSKKLIELENGLLMEVEVPESDIEMISGGDDLINKVESSMGTVEHMLIQSIQPVINTYNALNQEVILEKAEVEIGIGFSAEGNVFVAKGSASANLKVKLVLSPK